MYPSYTQLILGQHHGHTGLMTLLAPRKPGGALGESWRNIADSVSVAVVPLRGRHLWLWRRCRASIRRKSSLTNSRRFNSSFFLIFPFSLHVQFCKLSLVEILSGRSGFATLRLSRLQVFVSHELFASYVFI